MSLNILALALYAVGTLCVMLETYLEGERSGGTWDRCRICGLILSIIWPLQICAIALFVLLGADLKEPRRLSAD